MRTASTGSRGATAELRRATPVAAAERGGDSNSGGAPVGTGSPLDLDREPSGQAGEYRRLAGLPKGLDRLASLGLIPSGSRSRKGAWRAS
jgi:hypothetical protein